jgi:hypothetical protein
MKWMCQPTILVVAFQLFFFARAFKNSNHETIPNVIIMFPGMAE